MISSLRWLFPWLCMSAMLFLCFAGCSGPSETDDESAGGQTAASSGSSVGGQPPLEPGQCGYVGSPPACSETSAAPSDPFEIDSFIADTAVALRCDDGVSGEQLDLSAILAASQNAKLLIVGEVHGSREISDLSVALFQQMVRSSRVDAVALEIQMDVNDALSEYLTTGGGSIESTYALSAWLKNAYHALVIEARRQSEQGNLVNIFGIDVPLNLGWVHDQINAIAVTIEDESVRSLVTDKLPYRVDYDAFVPPSPPGYIDEAAAYVNDLSPHANAICGALDLATCRHLFALADALELGARRAAGGIKKGNYYERREALMTHNMNRIFSMGSKQVLAHLGSYHAAKGAQTMANQLLNEKGFDETDIYSLSVSFGAGSSLKYGGKIVNAGPSNDGLSSALSPLPFNQYLVSTRHPDAVCTSNPLENKALSLGQTGVPSTYGKAYDALVWYRQLTPHP